MTDGGSGSARVMAWPIWDHEFVYKMLMTSSQDYHRKVSDEFKRLLDNFQEHAEKGNLDKVIREHVKGDLDNLVDKNEKLSK